MEPSFERTFRLVRPEGAAGVGPQREALELLRTRQVNRMLSLMREFITKCVKRLRSGWGALTLLGVMQTLAHLWQAIGNFDLARTVLGWFGWNVGMIYALFLSPEFSICMAIFGIFGMVFLDSPKFVAKHPITPTLGVVIAVLVFSMTGALGLFAEALKTPRFAEIMHYYEIGHTQRHLTPKMKERIVLACAKHSLMKTLVAFGRYATFISSSTDNESQVYAAEIYNALRTCGMDLEETPQGDQAPGERGIMVTIADPKKPSPEAVDFMAFLKEAGISFTVEAWVNREGWPALPDYMLYVTPENPASQ